MSDSPERNLPASVVVLGVLIAGIAAAFVSVAPKPTPPPSLHAKPEVRLVVLVVFDQLRADLIARPDWREHFGPDGFRRLQEDGAWFTDCHYPYATTTTGPGHASLLTGAPPAVTGIVNNEWYDRKEKGEVYCAASKRFQIVPAMAKEPKFGAGNPEKLLAPTVADVLKPYTAGQGKVFGVSLKDRSGVLPSGSGKNTRPNGVFWFEDKFVTSTYYADAVPGWVAEFNTSGKAEAYFDKTWERVKPELDYDKLAGPDKQEGEGSRIEPKNRIEQGMEFPHHLNRGRDGKRLADIAATEGDYYRALANSPFGNELLLEFAKRCIDAEHLGADDTPDLLTVSFSSNDLIGHTWGPDSHEVLDSTLRSDAILAGLLKHLDEKVGKVKYAVILTADHGVCPLPEFAAKHPERYPDAKGAKRVSGAGLRKEAEKHLQEKFGNPADPKEKWIEEVKPPYFYLNHNLIRAKGKATEAVAEELANWLKTQDGAEEAFTADRLKGDRIETTRHDEAVRLAFHPDRSGDVYVVLKPYILFGDIDKDTKLPPSGTTHGSPHEYDTHVPLLVYGPGVRGGTRAEHVTPLHAAAIAAKFLGVPPPAKAMFQLPKTLAE